MDQFQIIVDRCEEASLKDFRNINDCLKTLLKEDLADFEIEWIITCLFTPPIQLPITLSEKKHDNTWNNVIADCFVHLSDMIQEWGQYVEKYIEDIIYISLETYAPHVKKRAIQCLITMVKCDMNCELPLDQYITLSSNPDEALSCRVPLYELLGEISRHKPDCIGIYEKYIWVALQNGLDLSKLTDSLEASIFSGLNGFLDHFGADVPVVELHNLFMRMRNRISSERNKAVIIGCMTLLGAHAPLFREKIIDDTSTKTYLWSALEKQSYDDGRNVIETIYKCLKGFYSIITASFLDNMEEFNKTVQEVYEKTLVENSVVQRQAYRLISFIIKQNRTIVSESVKTKYAREILDASSRIIFDLEQRVLAPKEGAFHDSKLMQLVEKACWLAVDGHALSDALFRNIILCHGHVYKSKVIAHALLNSEQYRAAAITHLIAVSCESEDAMDKYTSLWQSLFDSDHGNDLIVIEKSKFIFDEFFSYVFFYLDSVLNVNKDVEETKDEIKLRLSKLFRLSSRVIQMESVMEWLAPDVGYLMESTLTSIDRFGISVGAVMCMTELVKEFNFEEEPALRSRLCHYYKSLHVEMCDSEAQLCVNCLALIHAPVSFAQDSEAMEATLNAFSLIMSRKDVDSKLFISVVESFERFLVERITVIDSNRLSEILISVDKIRFSVNTADKHGRILKRKLLLFYGRYGGYIRSINEPEKLKLNSFKEYLSLDLPNCVDGGLVKINMHEIIRLSLKEDDFNTLHNILIMLCARSDTIKTLQGIERLVIELVSALCRCVRAKVGEDKMADIERLLKLYGNEQVLQCLVERIASEQSPGVRNLLCELLRVVCVSEAHIRVLYSHIQLMCESADFNKTTALNLIEVLLNATKCYNDMIQEYLPKLFILIIKTNDRNFVKTFDVAVECYSEKKWLFKEDEIRDLCQDLLKSNMSSFYEKNTFEIQIKKCLDFISGTNGVVTIGWIEEEMICKLYDKRLSPVVFSKIVYLLAKMADVLLSVELKRLIKENDFAMLKEIVLFMDTFDCDNNETQLLVLTASLHFLKSFYDELQMERYDVTMHFLSTVVQKLPTLHFNKIHEQFSLCCSSIGSVPDVIVESACLWLNKMDIDNITKELENEEAKETFVKVNAIKLFFKSIDIKKSPSVILKYAEKFKQWSEICLNKHEMELIHEKYKRALNDALSVSVLFMSDDETATLLGRGYELANDTSFCQKYMNVLSGLIVTSPLLTCERLQPHVSNIVFETLKYYGRNGYKGSIDDGDELYALVEKHWQTIIENNSNPMQYLIELDKSGSTVQKHGSCMRWLRAQVEDSKLVPVLVSDLPNIIAQCGDLFSAPIINFSKTLPLRMSEFLTRCDPRLFTVLLDALATTGNLDILDILYRRVIAKDESGWWNDAIDKCMSILAKRNDINLSLKLYDYVEKCPVLTTSVAEVLLVPLLRFSNRRHNEEFFSRTVKTVMEKLERTAATSKYERHLVNYTNSFLLLQVMFEKVSSDCLEGPNSILNTQLDAKRTWYLPTRVCTLCMTLRKQPREGASENFISIYRKFQCENYNTMVAALCKRRPLLKFYDVLFDCDVWELLVDCEREYAFDLEAKSSDTKRHMISSHMQSVPSNSVRATTRTTRSLFLGTLSDNPLKYDLLNEVAIEEDITQEVHLQDNELNSHPCSAVISLLLSQLSNLTSEERPSWIDKMAAVLGSAAPRNVKWFVAQIIINSAEDLCKYSSALTPPLWSVVMDTCLIANEKKYLNGLHINIIKTIFKWSNKETVATKIEGNFLELIVNTLYHHKLKSKTLINILSDYINLYGNNITVDWDLFDVNSVDPKTQDITLDVLLRISKNRTYIPQLITYTLEKIQSFDKEPSYLKELSELFGLSLSACACVSEKERAVRRFRDCVKRLEEKDPLMYIKVLYYVSLGSGEFFNENIFSKLIYLAPKQARARQPRKWCYTLLATYLSQMKDRDDTTAEMFDVLNIPEMLTEEDAGVAVSLAQDSFHLMDDGLKRRIVFLIDDIYICADESCRLLCAKFFLRAFQDTIKLEDDQPTRKRSKPNTPSSAIIQSVTSDDAYVKCIYRNIGKALVDKNKKIHDHVYSGLLGFLDKNHLGVRFCEIISLMIALPLSGAGDADSYTSVSADTVTLVAIKLWLQVLRDDNNCKKKLLSDIPLKDDRSPNSDIHSRLLTISATYVGTFRTRVRSPRTYKSGDEAAMLNIQIPVEDVLVAVLEFCETKTEASMYIFVEIFQWVIERDGDMKRTMASVLFVVLQHLKVGELSQVFVHLARAIAFECSQLDGFITKVKELFDYSRGSEAELLIKLLQEELLLHRTNDIHLTRPTVGLIDQSHQQHEFSLDELSTYFNKLSNWDHITEQKRQQYCQLTTSFWTNDSEFVRQIESYERKNSLYKMFRVYNGVDANQWNYWLDEAARWPRRAFSVSALAEAFASHSAEGDRAGWLDSYTSIGKGSCAALWAVRLMIRSSQLDVKENNLRKYEMQFAREMNRRGFTAPALQCIQRNVRTLHEAKNIGWHIQRCVNVRNSYIPTNDKELLLKELLDKCVKLNTEKLTPNNRLSLNIMMLKLKLDLNVIGEDEMKPYVEELRNYAGVEKSTMEDMADMFTVIADYYLDLFERYKAHEHLKQITRIYPEIVKYKKYIVSNNNMYVTSLLYIISLIDNSESAYGTLFDMLEKLDIELGDTVCNEIQRALASLPEEIVAKYPKLKCRRNEESTLIKLLRCPSYALMSYCDELSRHLKCADAEKWAGVMSAVYSCLFDTRLGGAEYVLINKYKEMFNEIKQFEHTSLFREKAIKLLVTIQSELNQRGVSDFILLRDLCPVLADCRSRLCEEERVRLERVLRVPAGCTIVKFEPKLQVFTSSIKRPLLLRATLSNGVKCGYLIKYKEDLRTDASCQSILSQFGTMTEYTTVTYRVTPLGSDGGVIQYLDNHVTLKGLIRKYFKLEDVFSSRVSDEKLILQPMNSAVSYFRNICEKIPANSLRNSMSLESESVHEFIYKKNNFVSSLSVITIWHWILGMGDRHLENILFSFDTGLLCSVDWEAIFEHAVYRDCPELLPARLSRCILGVVGDIEELESKLQNILKTMRKNYKKIMRFIHLAFRWRCDYSAQGFQNTLKSIENKLQGSVLPYEITRNILEESNVKYKEKYIDVLNGIFCDERKDAYTVQEQVYYLLQQCTDVKILSITRSGWEPWL